MRRPGDPGGGPGAHGRRDAREVHALQGDAAGPHRPRVPQLRLPLPALARRGGRRGGRDVLRQLRGLLLLLPLQRARGKAVPGVQEGDRETGAAERARGHARNKGLPRLRDHDREDRRLQPHDVPALRHGLVLDLRREARGWAGGGLRALPRGRAGGLQAVRGLRPEEPSGVPPEVPGRAHPAALGGALPAAGPDDAGVVPGGVHLPHSLPQVLAAV
mmetsp:Transcript_56340/g.164688  ORF Transcript_56340/g.164688 Transcript_56340/m.164688 type:complete len:217 (-) Transcript_56340:584-1234(-)